MEEANSSKKTVLIIEDDALLLKFYERAFNVHGLEVILAENGEKGLKAIYDRKPDFVILDILMPNIDGIEVLKKIRADENLKDLPVMIVTNYDLPEYRKSAENLKVFDYILKVGVDPLALVKRVRDFLSYRNFNP